MAETYTDFEYYAEQVLKEKECYQLFCAYALKTRNDENTRFSEAMLELKKVKATQQKEHVTKIFNDYVKNGSKWELNVPDAVRTKCLERIQKEEYDSAFEDCIVAVEAHLRYLFALFKCSETFNNFLKQKSIAFLKVIGTPKSALVHHQLNVKDMERPHFAHSDFELVHELIQAYGYWKTVYVDQGSALLYSARVFQTAEAVTKYGYLSPLKTSFTIQCQCTLQQLLSIVVCPDFLKQFYPLVSIETIQVVKDTYPSVIVRGTYRLGKLFDLRYVCEVWTIHQFADKFCIIRKCCESSANTFPKDGVIQRAFTVVTFKELMPNMFHVDHVALSNFGGSIAFTPSSQKTAMKFFKLLKGAHLKAFKSVIMNHVDKLNKQTWVPKDELGLLQVVQSYSQVAQQQQVPKSASL